MNPLDNIIRKEQSEKSLWSRTEAIMHVKQIVTYAVVKKGMGTKAEQ